MADAGSAGTANTKDSGGADTALKAKATEAEARRKAKEVADRNAAEARRNVEEAREGERAKEAESVAEAERQREVEQARKDEEQREAAEAERARKSKEDLDSAAPNPKAENLKKSDAGGKGLTAELPGLHEATLTADTVTAKEEKTAVQELIDGKGEGKEADAARSLFGRKVNGELVSPDTVVRSIAYDIANPPEKGKTMSGPESSAGNSAAARYLKPETPENVQAARRWVKKNMPEASKRLENEIKRQRKLNEQTEGDIQALLDVETGETPDEYEAALDEKDRRDADRLDKQIIDLLELDPFTSATAAAMDTAGHPAIRMFVKAGDAKSALQAIALTSKDPDIRRLAAKIADNIGDTKIEMVPTDSIGGLAAVFDPATNTIKVATDATVTPHLIMHEAAHAVVVNNLNNKGHPTTKKLERIFEDLQAHGLDGNLPNLKEFVAEFMSNEGFRRQLAMIFPPKSEMSLFERALDAIRTFLKRHFNLTAGGKLTMEKLDRMVDEIVAPSAQNAAVAQVYFTPATVLKNLDSALSKRLGEKKKDAVIISNFEQAFKNAGSYLQGAGLGFLPMPQLFDAGSKYLPKAFAEYRKSINEYTADIHAGIEQIGEGPIRDMHRWRKDNSSESYEDLKAVLLDGSLAQIDFRKGLKHYEDMLRDAKKPKDREEAQNRVDEFKRLKPRWDKLNKNGGQELYKKIRATYDKLHKELINLIKADVNANSPDKITADRLTEIFINEIENRGALDGYFPLYREGDYLLAFSYINEKGKTEDFFGMFKTERERDVFATYVKENADLVKPGKMKKRELSSQQDLESGEAGVRKPIKKITDVIENPPPSSLIAKVMDTLKTSGVDDATMERVMRIAVEMSPQSSLAKMLRRRQGVDGYSTDVADVFEKTSMRMYRKNVSLKHRDRMGKVLTMLKEEAEPKLQNDENGKAVAMYQEELRKRVAMARDPFLPAAANYAKTAAYTWTLGFNPSSAIIDTAAIPMVLYPHLRGDHKGQNVWNAISNASRIVMGSGMKHKVEGYATKGLTDAEMAKAGFSERDIKEIRAIQSLANYDFDDPNLPKAVGRYKTLVDTMRANGQVQRVSALDDTDMLGEGLRMGRFNAWQGAMMQASERYRREVTMIAKYDLLLEQMEKKGRKIDEAAMKEAADKAVKLSEEVNGSTAMLANMRHAQTPIGSVALMYKRYGISMMYLQLKMLRRGFMDKSLTPEERSAARTQLFSTMAMSGLFAGARGMPMMGIIATMWDMFMLDDDEDDFDTMMRKNANAALGVDGGTMFMEGILNSLLGMNIAPRIALTDMMFRYDPHKEEQTPSARLGTLLGGPALGSAERAYRGWKQVEEGHVYRGMENILPSAVSNATLKMFRFATEGARTVKGDIIVEDIGPMSVFGQFLGFSPAEYARKQSFVTMAKAKDRRILQMRSALYDRAWMARSMGDIEEFMDTIEDIEKFNDSVDDPKAKIDIGKDLGKSFKIRQKLQAEKMFGVTAASKSRWQRDAEDLFGDDVYF